MSTNERGEEEGVFEVALVIPKSGENKGEESDDKADCVEVLADELRKKGLIVEVVSGSQNEFVKLLAPMEVLGKAASELRFPKRTTIGTNLPFDWDEAEAFVRQPDGSLFGWFERYRCYNHLMYGIVNTGKSVVVLRSGSKEVDWNPGEPLLGKLESMGIVKEVFPLHDENKRKQLLRSWAMNWLDFTSQPIDEISSYYGVKIATYFAFLGLYSKWLLFPAILGFIVYLVNFGSLQFLVLPFFFICLISWAALFFQFWKRKNSALATRYHMYNSATSESGFKFGHKERSSSTSPSEDKEKKGTDKLKEKAVFQREEWVRTLTRLKNDTYVISGIIFLQLPFEVAYAHLNEIIASDLLKFFLTTVYMIGIQTFTKKGSKISMKLVKYENDENPEQKANSLVYKVFGVYFMQSYIGIFYHVLVHRNFTTLRQVLVQRLVVAEVIQKLLENAIPYLVYVFKKFGAIRNKKKHEKQASNGEKQSMSRVEKEYLKPSYAASIGQELEDGLFDDFLELVKEFGMMMMFACAFPLAFAFAAVNNITEIRTDALKLLANMRRPIPRADATIGAWLNIFQLLLVASVCTNSALLVCLYDQEGNWNLAPGLSAILIMEHVALFLKFGLSRIVPEEPEWVRATRKKNVTQAEQMCSKQLLRSISRDKHSFTEMKKND